MSLSLAVFDAVRRPRRHRVSAVLRLKSGMTGGCLRGTGWLLAAILALLVTALALGQEGDSTTPSTPISSSAPTQLTGSIEQTGVVLSWTAPTLETDSLSGYRVERRRLLEYETSWVAIVEHSNNLATSYTDATANVNGARYEFRVQALRGGGQDPDVSAASNLLIVTIPNPPRPQQLTAASSADGIALAWSTGHLSWQALTLPLTGYEILRIETSHSGNRRPQWEVLVDSTGNTDTSYLDATGFTTITYSYAIRAVHGFVRSYWEGIAGPVAGHLTPDDSE